MTRISPHITSFRVNGMSCGHCVRAVSDEIGALAGVGDVDVDLATGTVTVTSDKPLDHAELAAAVYEAGCEVVS
ncbi:cation transporter [Thermopolyspora sp. NPDC052614]|uniref:heavy-metal-associated domain-containing protein n=1 Tax=Thermopolyspora sp. NPDC052614 TaxID=3155682 RepID=UPI003432A447